MNSSAGERERDSGKGFPYEMLLAYLRHEVSESTRAWIEEQLQTRPLWKTHLESIRFLDLEREAAIQDAKDLRELVRRRAFTPFCRYVARHGHSAFAALQKGTAGDDVGSAAEWAAHVKGCPYCRRMRRVCRARAEAEKKNLGGLLLRDWLLCRYYARALAGATRALLQRTPHILLLEKTPAGFRGIRIGPATANLTSSGGTPLPLLAWVVTAGEFRSGGAVAVRGRAPTEPVEKDVEAPGTPGVVQLSQPLDEDRGELDVTFRLAEGRVSWQAALVHPADSQATLEVEIDSQRWEQSGQEARLVLSGDLPPGALGQTKLRVRVSLGEDVAEEYTFVFDEST
jgi:hypothetical protein